MRQIIQYIKDIPDFPVPGVMFHDITSLIQDPDGFQLAVDGLLSLLKDTDYDIVVGPESRGFIFGAPIAYVAGKGFVPARKKGKLPREVISAEYDLEYGKAVVEMHKDAIQPGEKVVVIDDLLATGGTTQAIINLIEQLGGKVVKICFVIELDGLHGSNLLKDYQVESLVHYGGK